VDLSNPIRSVIPSAHGSVLAVLARTDQSLSGRRVAELTGGRVSARGTSNALRALAEAGVVLVEDHPPAKLYRLNRRHLAADAIVALAEMRPRLLEALRERLGGWKVGATASWLFGSAARGDGSIDSDIDVLLVRADRVDPDDDVWNAQIDELADDVRAWTGNRCSVVEYSATDFRRLIAGPERLADELRADGIRLTGDMELRVVGRRHRA